MKTVIKDRLLSLNPIPVVRTDPSSPLFESEFPETTRIISSPIVSSSSPQTPGSSTAQSLDLFVKTFTNTLDIIASQKSFSAAVTAFIKSINEYDINHGYAAVMQTAERSPLQLFSSSKLSTGLINTLNGIVFRLNQETKTHSLDKISIEQIAQENNLLDQCIQGSFAGIECRALVATSGFFIGWLFIFCRTSEPLSEAQLFAPQAVSKLFDITEKQQKDFSLQDTLQHIPLFANTSYMLVESTEEESSELRILYANEAMEDLTGYLKQEIIGKPLSFLSGDLSHICLGKMQELSQKTQTDPVKFEFTNRNREVSDMKCILQRPKNRYSLNAPFIVLLQPRDSYELELKELSQQQRYFRGILDNIPDFVFVKDNQSRYTMANISYSLFLGSQSPETVIGKTDYDFYSKDEADRFRTDEHAILKFGQVILGREERRMDKDGHERWLSISKVPLRDDEGKTIGLVGLAVDITKNKEAESALRREKDFVTTVIDAAGALVTVYDPEGRIVRFNKECEKLTGYTVAQAWGQQAIDLFLKGPQEQKTFADIFERLKRGIHPIEVDLLLTDKNGKNLDIHWQYSVTHDSAGKVEYIIAVGINMTERKKAEQNLLTEKQRLATTIASITDGVITTDSTGRIILMNQVAQKLTGWNETSAFTKQVAEVFQPLEEKTKKPIFVSLNTSSTKDSLNRYLLVSKDQSERLVSFGVSGIRDAQNNEQGTIIVIRDETEKEKLEKELRNADRLESLGTLAGGIAHDFNNILTSIGGNMSLARSFPPISQMAEERLLQAENSVQRARDLSMQLLTFAKGGDPIKKVSPINDLVRQACTFGLRGAKSKAHFDIPEDLFTAEVDQGQLTHALSNIVLNANQSMKDGGNIYVSCRNAKVGQDPFLQDKTIPYESFVKIQIRDEGVGIPQENLSKIFDPFFSTRPKASGLGLSTAYSIIKKHNGYIYVTSSEGKGTTVYIYLPALSSPVSHPMIPKIPRAPSVKTQKVLVIDDEEDIRTIVEGVLTQNKYLVTAAEDNQHGLSLFQEALNQNDPYQLLIMDLTIPGEMPSKEAILKFKDLDPRVRAIVSSGYSNDPIMANFRDYGFDGVLAKPYRLTDLVKTVKETIED